MDAPDHIADYLKYCMETRAVAEQSYIDYSDWLRQWKLYAITKLGHGNVAEATRQMIMDYKATLESEGKQRSTIMSYMGAIKRLYKWMLREGRVTVNPYPEELFLRPPDPNKPKLVLTPEQIMLIRGKREQLIHAVAEFETLLCTGCRIGELLQIRMEDIAWGDIPIDTETGAPSKYIVGSIAVNPENTVTKGKQFRKVYISAIAGRMLRRYIEAMGIPEKSPLPLFPFHEDTVSDHLEALGDGIVAPPQGVKTSGPRTQGYQDVAVEKFRDTMDPRFLNAVARRQQQEARKQDKLPAQANQASLRNTKSKRTKLHPHAMRHSFTCLSYYRNWFGERQNLVRLQQLLGHRDAPTTLIYLTKLDVVSTDHLWERVWIGKPIDWMYTRLPYQKFT